jgi:hypothetical protein
LSLDSNGHFHLDGAVGAVTVDFKVRKLKAVDVRYGALKGLREINREQRRPYNLMRK